MRSWDRIHLGLSLACLVQCAQCTLPPTTDRSRRVRSSVDLHEFCYEPDYNFTKQLRQTSFGALSRQPFHRLKAESAWWERIYQHRLLLTEKMLAEGRSNLGNTRRLEGVMHKLLTGQPVTFAVVGGSISAGVGPIAANNSYVSRVFHWVNTTFPHTHHQFHVFALPATTSAYYAPCVTSTSLPSNTDLVLVEFTFNDSEMAFFHHTVDDRTRRGLERLVRKILRMQSRPALLYYHYWPPQWPLYNGTFWHGGEHFSEEILGYYGVPALSLRAALHHRMDEERDLVGQLWWPPDVLKDQLHPNCIGQRAMSARITVPEACRFMADHVIGALQDAAASVLFQGNELPGLEDPELPLPEPFFEGNAGEGAELCVHMEDFKPLVMNVQGWLYGDASENPEKPQMGFMTDVIGASLEIVVPIDPDKRALQFPSSVVLVAVEVLQFWKIMGIVLLQCSGGCACQDTEYSLLHPPGTLDSHKYWKSVEVMLAPHMGNCILKVTNSLKTRSGFHRAVISGIMVSSELGFINTHKWCPECLPEGQPLGALG